MLIVPTEANRNGATFQAIPDRETTRGSALITEVKALKHVSLWQAKKTVMFEFVLAAAVMLLLILIIVLLWNLNQET